jgi:hypothetical protein
VPQTKDFGLKKSHKFPYANANANAQPFSTIINQIPKNLE